jgi:hypothetical protein
MIDSMAAFADWFPQAFVGTFFILMGCLKLYGFARGIKGGRDKPFGQRLRTTNSSRPATRMTVSEFSAAPA